MTHIPTIGQTAELIWEVTPGRSIALGNGQAVVFSTPSMINLMEHAAKKLLATHLTSDEESVGMDVHVEHVAATPLNATVRAVAKVTSVDGRTIGFDVEAFDATDRIGFGTHKRAVIRIDSFAKRLAEKSPAMNAPATTIVTETPLIPNTGALPATDLITVQMDAKIAVMSLNRPNNLNAMIPTMTDQMLMLMHWFAGHANEVRAIIFTGTGRAFCAGNDIKVIASLSPAESEAWNVRQAQLFMMFTKIPQPIIAAINGACFGGGVVAACACDMRIASHNATFGMPEANWGWPPSFGFPQLVHAVGKPKAIEICLRGHTFSASEAKAMGFVSDTLAPAMLMRAARQIAVDIAGKSPAAVQATKRLIHQFVPGANTTTETQTNALYMDCVKGDDAREGMAAFTEKRKPKFK